MIEIKETTEGDLENLRSLWVDGDVMRYVGFPDGLHQSAEEMRGWYNFISSSRPRVNHYSVFDDGEYCGETYYEIDAEHGNSAALDIKLFKFARGKGIAYKALSFAIGEAFKSGAEKVWVDPNPKNEKALALYERLHFERKPMPDYIADDEYPEAIYMELTKEQFY